MLKIVDVSTRMILIPGIWIFIFMNIPELREKIISLVKPKTRDMKIEKAVSNIHIEKRYYRKVV